VLEHPPDEAAHDVQPLRGDIEEDELVDRRRSPRRANPSTSSGVYVLPPPMTATFRPIEASDAAIRDPWS
jgi:hypothetical protein